MVAQVPAQTMSVSQATPQQNAGSLSVVSSINSMPGVLVQGAPSMAFMQAYPSVDQTYQTTIPTAVAYAMNPTSSVLNHQQQQAQQQQQKARPSQKIYAAPVQQRGRPM